jgi:hypothetical protein
VYTCPCNGHAYPSKTALQSHRKTKSHIAWQDREELRELKIALTQRDNTISLQVEALRSLNTQLIERIRAYYNSSSLVNRKS